MMDLREVGSEAAQVRAAGDLIAVVQYRDCMGSYRLGVPGESVPGIEPATRLLLVGPRGSGKSHVLSALRASMIERGVATGTVDNGSPTTPVSVLVVDDAHLLTDERLSLVVAHMEGGGGVLMACRPFPRSDLLRTIAQRFAADEVAVRETVDTGHLRHLLDRSNRTLSDECVDAIAAMCASVPWLVGSALRFHGAGPCDDPSHSALNQQLRSVIVEQLNIVDPAVSRRVTDQALRPAVAGGDGSDATLLVAFSEGLLLRNGELPPIVRSAVLESLASDTLVDRLVSSDVIPDDVVWEAIQPTNDTRVAAALLEAADRTERRDPESAAALYRRAAAWGADGSRVALGLARTAWAQGHVGDAAILLDQIATSKSTADREGAADLAGAVWASRGLMSTSRAAFDALVLQNDVVVAHSEIARLALGDVSDLPPLPPAPRAGLSSVSVAMHLVRKGIRSSAGSNEVAALSEFVQAAEIYTASGSSDPIPELPAVIAAIAATNLGELDVANDVLTDAIRDGHGGEWARPRLMLWSAWVDLRLQRPREARRQIDRVNALPGGLSARDQFLRDAVSLALMRRYGDSSEMGTVWRRACDTLLRIRVDAFSIPPLTDVMAVAPLQENPERVRAAYQDALAIAAGYGPAALWSVQLRWAGIQQAILLGKPDELALHARGLVEEGRHNRVARAMAMAGRVWTEVRSGSVVVDEVEAASAALAEVGMGWDGARLASHGAGHTENRQEIARLLSVARDLHPRQDVHHIRDSEPSAQARRSALLSNRELEVAALVVQGKTYAEIGQTIFVSPRTVEHHVARMRRRIGAVSRSDLIGKLRAILEDTSSPSEPPGTDIDSDWLRGGTYPLTRRRAQGV